MYINDHTFPASDASKRYLGFGAYNSYTLCLNLNPKCLFWTLAVRQRVQVPNNWLRGFRVIVIVVQVLGKYILLGTWILRVL